MPATGAISLSGCWWRRSGCSGRRAAGAGVLDGHGGLAGQVEVRVIGEVDLSGGVGGGPVVDRAAVSETVLVSFLRQGEMLKKISRPEMAAHSPVQ